MALPSSIRKIVVTTLSSNFRKAVELQTASLPKLQAGCVLVKNRFVGINASDINFTSGKYRVRILPVSAVFDPND